MDYKDDDFLDPELINSIKEKRRKESDAESTTEEESHIKKKFDINDYIISHPTFNIRDWIPFTSSDLDELISKINPYIKTRSGRVPSHSFKTRLFLTLTYYSSNITLKQINNITGISSSSLERMVNEMTRTCFPLFINLFLPKKIVPCRQKFKNFPSAVGAIDTTTVPHNRPILIKDQKKTFDFKRHKNGAKLQILCNPEGLAIQAYATLNGSMHDKCLFEVSKIKKILTIKKKQG